MAEKYRWLGKRLIHELAPVGQQPTELPAGMAWQGSYLNVGRSQWHARDVINANADLHCKECGYQVCNCPTTPEEPPLPEGWRALNEAEHQYVHKTGAVVTRQHHSGLWAYYPYGAYVCQCPAKTRGEAMTAALVRVPKWIDVLDDSIGD